MATYRIDLFDNQGKRLSSLENTQRPRLVRRRNEPGQITFQLPASDDKRQHLGLGRLVKLYRNGEVVAAGRVAKRDFSKSPWSITALTREQELNGLQTPPEWGPVWEGRDLADVLRDLLKGYIVEHISTGFDSDPRVVEATGVDRTTDPGRVWLAREDYFLGKRFVAEGTLVIRFDAGVSGHAGWERVRWRERVGEVTHLYVSYRTSDDATGWSAWSTEVEAIDGDGVSYAEQRGIELSGPTRYLEVRFRFLTDDQDTQNPDPAPAGAAITYGYTPELQAVEVTRRFVGSIAAGDIPSSTGVQVRGVEANNARHLAVLQDLCETYGYDFRVTVDGDLDLAPTLETDRTAEVVITDGVNCQVRELADEDAKIINDLTAYGAGEGLDRLTVRLRNEESIQALGGDPQGLRPGTVEFPEVTTLQELQARAQEYLDEHAGAPRFSVTFHPAAATAIPDVRLLDRIKVAVPRSQLVTTAVIEEEQRELTSKGEALTLGLNATLPDLLDRFRRARRRARDTSPPPAPTNLVAKGRPGFVQLTWQGVGDKFLIQHASPDTSGNPGPWRVVDEKTGTTASFNRLGVDSEHFYRVIAVVGARRSAPSEYVKVRAGIEPPSVPAGLVLSTATEVVEQTTVSSVTASWVPNQETDLSRYEVRWRRGGGDWNYIGSVGLNLSIRILPIPGSQPIGVQVRAVNYDNVASDWSEEASIRSAADPQAPAVPTGLVVEPHKLGTKARWSPNTEPDLAGYRVQYRLDGGAWTTVFVGKDTERLVQADPGVLVEVRLRAEDTSDNVSNYSGIKGATAQALDGSDYGGGTVETIHIAQRAVSNMESIEVNDSAGAVTTSPSPVDIPGYSITFTLDEPAACIITMSLSGLAVREDPEDELDVVIAWFRLLLDGVEIKSSRRPIGVQAARTYYPDYEYYEWLQIYGSISFTTTRLLGAGQHTIRGQFNVEQHDPPSGIVYTYYRVLGVTILKR